MQSSPSEFAGRDRTELRSHLTSYWKMEAGNVLLIPAMGCGMLWSGDVRPDAATIAGMAACSLLLVIGTAAWRMALAGLDGDTALAEKLTAACARAEWPSLAVLVLATAMAAASVMEGGWLGAVCAVRILGEQCGRGGRDAASEPTCGASPTGLALRCEVRRFL